MSEKLGQKQERFSICLAMLILKAGKFGYGVRVGEVWRHEILARHYASIGKGIINSNHCNKCAVDIILTIDGVVQWGKKGTPSAEPYRKLGEWWKSLGPDHYWGGDFRRRDVYHYSIKHAGVI